MINALDSSSAPVRTCLGCKKRDAKAALIRLVARDGKVVADLEGKLPGRGVYVHPTEACVAAAVQRKLNRALKVDGPLDASSLTDEIQFHKHDE